VRFIDYRAMSDHDILKLDDARGDASDDKPVDHWITKNHRHIPITESQAHAQEAEAKIYSGDATYYKLPGHKTASGERFDPNRMAAAMTSDKVKLGQTVKLSYSYEDEQRRTVTRTISVVVNDRGAF
jgi:rare lipoprotein A (peptidoglycan hydrolase)